MPVVQNQRHISNNPTDKMANRSGPLSNPSNPRKKRFLGPSRSNDRSGISESICHSGSIAAPAIGGLQARGPSPSSRLPFFLIDEGVWLQTVWLLPARASRHDKRWSFDRGKYLRQTHYLRVHDLLRQASRPIRVH